MRLKIHLKWYLLLTIQTLNYVNTIYVNSTAEMAAARRGGGCSWVTDKHQQNMVHTHSILVRSPPAAPWAWCHIMLLEATLIRSSRKVMEHARDLIRRWSSVVGKVTLTLGQVIPSFTRPGPPCPLKRSFVKNDGSPSEDVDAKSNQQQSNDAFSPL